MNASFEEQKKTYFFSAREFFNGKSLCDICLNDPLAILEALKGNKKDIVNNKGCLMDSLLQGHSESTLKNFRNNKLLEQAHIVSQDFNFVS